MGHGAGGEAAGIALGSPKAVAVLWAEEVEGRGTGEHREAVPVPFTPTALILAARAAKSRREQLGGITSVRRNWSFKFSLQVEGRDQTSDCRVIYKTQCHRNSLFCPTEPHG